MVSGKSCHCPFCSPRGLPVAALAEQITRRWQFWTLLMLVLLSEGVRSDEETSRRIRQTSAHARDSSVSVTNPQIIHLNETTENIAECGSKSCHCQPVGRCKRCSKFEIGKQATECLLTGFKVRAYCSSIKKEKYKSCHYRRDPSAERAFVMFEGVMFFIAVLSYTIVFMRHRNIERALARRIQQQINA